MEKLSKDQEMKIAAAMKASIVLVNAGASPDEAIAKVAAEQRLGTPFIGRMVEAMNTSRTLAHLKNASGPERASSFALADASNIMEMMYPTKITAPAVKAAAAYVPDVYTHPERDDFMKPKLEHLPFPHAVKKAETYPQDPQIIAYKVHSHRHGLQMKKANAESLYRQKLWHVIDLTKEAARYFRLVGAEPFDLVEKKAYATYGDSGTLAMDIIHRQTDQRAKRAQLDAKQSQMIFDESRQPYKLIGEIIKVSAEVAPLAHLASEAGLELERFNKQHEILDDLTRPKIACPLDSVLGDEQAKEAVDLGTAALVGGMSALGLKDPNAEGARRDAINDLYDPEHEAALRSAKVTAMLNDMVSNDPILSSYDPSDVTGAYNQIAQMTPNVAQQPMVMRGMLRKILQQGGVMEPFEAHQVSEIEKRLTSQNEPPKAESPKPAGNPGM